MSLLTIPMTPIAASTDNAFPDAKNSNIKKLPFLLQIFQIAYIIASGFIFGKMRKPKIVRQIWP